MTKIMEKKQYIGSLYPLNNGCNEYDYDCRYLYIEDTGIFLGPANSKIELIELAESELGHPTADEDLSWDVPFSKMQFNSPENKLRKKKGL